MGRDKALLAVDGVAMAARVASALRAAGCDPVVAIGGDELGLSGVGLVVVPDRWPGEGPLGGVITSLEAHARADAVFVVACDLPWITPSTVKALRAGLDVTPQTDAVVAVTDRPQPLCVVWRRAALPTLRSQFSSGERRVHVALAALQVTEVAVNPQDLVNVNSPGDLPD